MEAMDLFIDIIRKERTHPNYNRVVMLKDKYTRYITGEDMDQEMSQFNRRESLAEFDQRKTITKHITKTVCRNLMKPQFKVPRSNGIVRVLEHKDKDKKTDLVGILSKFWGDKSLDEWMSQRWIELSNIDPNAFCVLEWKDFDNTTEFAKPYPLEISSNEAVMFEYENNNLQYLVTRRKETILVKDVTGTYVEKIRDRYTWYDKIGAVVMLEVLDTPVFNNISFEEGMYEYNGLLYYRIGGKVYQIIKPLAYNLDFVPAFRIGYERDLYTNGETLVSPLDDVLPILEKMVKANSEMDLTMALHAFPQKIQYVKRCSNDLCNRGYLPDGGGVCPVCHGEGLDVATTTQEVIRLELPRSSEDVIKLDNIVHYVFPPVDLIKFQKEYIASLIEQCKSARYNSDIFSRSEIVETATSKNIDLQNVYDTLYPMAQDYAREWEFLVRAIAKITDMIEGLECKMLFPKDFKMKSLSELYLDLKVVSDSNADPFLKQHIYDDIATYIYQDDSQELKRYMTKREFYPFSGKSAADVVLIVNSDLTTRFNKVFWANEGVIYDEIEFKHADFYELTREQQWELIKAQVNKIMTQTDTVDLALPTEK